MNFDQLTSLPIDTGDPVVREHPLNRGRVAWYLTLPYWYGGRQWFDLMGLNHGTLTNMTSTGGWRSSARPGGWGGLQFDGVNDSVEAGKDYATIITNDNLTISLWFNATSLVGVGGMCVVSDLVAGAALEWAMIQVNGEIWAISQAVSNVQAKATIPAASTWNHIVGVFSASNSRSIYLNGVFVQTETTSNAVAPAVKKVRMGWRGSNIQQFAGMVDDVQIFSRILSAVEIRSLYDNSRLGYPGMLRRVVPWNAFVSTPPVVSASGGFFAMF